MTMVTTKQKHQAAAQKLLENANEILASVDASDFCQQQTMRDYPHFKESEISLGPVLGIGGFCIVYEVEEFKLKDDSPPAEKVSSNEVKESTTEHQKVGDSTSSPSAKHPLDDHESGEHHHYDARTARTLMKNNVLRNGDARYAIKRLDRDQLSELELARGMIDLAIETKFLSRLWHPNIIKMRGHSTGPLLHRNNFVILDRLYETLDVRIKQWELELYPDGKPGVLKKIIHRRRRSKSSKEAQEQLTHDILLQRMIVAYDLAAAFNYMHQNRLVYRDVKQDNIGFDVRGDVKVFDFGLCKGLSPSLRARDSKTKRVLYGYNLTARTGSVPYMAPEVADCKPYDSKCDVFSFAILLWEMLSFKRAFEGYKLLDYLDLVVKKKERPRIPKSWPPMMRHLIAEAWDPEPKGRPAMKRIATILRGALNDMSADESVQNRTTHMIDRSSHSQRALMRALGLDKQQ